RPQPTNNNIVKTSKQKNQARKGEGKLMPDITGLITDANGQAVPNVQVTATLQGGAALPAVQTNAQGQYTIPNAPAGNYDVSLQQVPANLQTPAAPTPVVVAAAAVQQNFPLPAAAPAPGSIAGQVTDAAGQPVAGAQATARRAGAAALAPVQTDNQGRYNIPNLPAGNYSVEVRGPANLPNPARAQIQVAQA